MFVESFPSLFMTVVFHLVEFVEVATKSSGCFNIHIKCAVA